MALKRILQTLDGLSDDEKKHYKETQHNGATEYHLDLGGDEDVAALLRARDHEKANRQAAEEKARAAEAKLQQAQRDAGDIPSLTRQWNEQFEAQKADFEKKLQARDAQTVAIAVENKAKEIAVAISTAPELLEGHVAKQLKGEMRDGRVEVYVVNSQGERSTQTFDQFKEHLKTVEQFKPILIGSRAAGGGANGGGNGGGGADQGMFNGKKYAELNDKERIEFNKTDPEGFKKAYGLK